MLSGKTILIAPLDWGLGHATRCVPLIRQLQNNNRVLLGVTPLTSLILNNEFPELKKIELPAYNIRYSSALPLWMKLGLDSPRIASVIREERNLVRKIAKEESLNVIISDNRFGLHSNITKNIFITHQLHLKTPFLQSFAQSVNRRYIQNFDEVWVPDFEDPEKSLSGELSHGSAWHPKINYIGPQSRLQKTGNDAQSLDHLLLLSGPQPAQSLFRERVLVAFAALKNLRCAVISPEPFTPPTANVSVFVAPDAVRLSQLITGSDHIICRSGYSTLMDLHMLGKQRMTLVPTPGQSEQIYLAQYWKLKFGAMVQTQNKFRLK